MFYQNWAPLILLATLANVTMTRAAAADLIVFQFGRVSLGVERQIVRGQPSPFQYSAEGWSNATHYSMKADQWLYLDLSSPALIPALPSCGRGVVEVRLLPLPADFRQERKDWFASGTSYPGVSRLTPPNAEVGIDVYEFDREDLRDAWGNKQAFYVRGVAAVMSIHAAPEIDVMVTRRADDCFFENGSEIARHIRDFLLDRMKVER